MGMDEQRPFDRREFSNGLVLLSAVNRRLPLVSLNAFVLAGTGHNDASQPGVASMTSRLLDEGTQRYTAQQISQMVEDKGSTLSTFSQQELSGICLQLRSHDLTTGIELLGEMLSFPTFPASRFSIEKEKVLNHLKAAEDDPQGVMANLFAGLIYAGSPLQYPALGTYEAVEEMSADDLLGFHGKHYGPQNTVLVVVGDIETSRLQNLVEERLSRWQNPDFVRAPTFSLKRQKTPLLEEKVMEDKEQVHICLGHLGISRDSPDFYPIQVMDVILGSGPGFTSRIPRKLRDQEGLAYSTYSDLSGSAGLYPGRFLAYISTSRENQQRALDGLLSEIQNFAATGPTDEEVLVAQDFLTGSFVFDFETNAHVARFLLSAELFDLGLDYPERYPHLIRKITRDKVAQVAHRHLDTVNFTTVIVGPNHAPEGRKARRQQRNPAQERCPE